MGEQQLWIHSGEACNGLPVFYTFSRSERSEDCPDCKAGVCVQRVERCGAWESMLVVHAWQRGAN